jgi:hypothetical protein
MCWDVTIVHRNDSYLTDADYWSRLGADTCFDPCFREYLRYVQSLRVTNPAPTNLPMLPQHMPYYRGPRLAPRDETPPTDVDAAYCQNLLSAILDTDLGNGCHLSNHPVKFGDLDSVTPVSAHASNNNDAPCLASHISHFSWAVYSFGGGHFVSMIISQNIPFRVSLACD